MKALITGVTGQDGSYLSELLLEKGYEVHGTKRRSSSFNTGRVDHLIIHPRFKLHYGDVCDSLSMVRLLEEIRPDEIYNLAAQSHVAVSFEMPEYSADAAGMGAIRLFEAARMSGLDPRIYQASSSEMFGDSPAPQSLASHFRPCSPYACAKLMAHHAARVYRESYGMYISCGILFNHESPRRGETFVTRKIARAVAQIKAGKQEHLYLGNLEAKRDWGYAPEYVDAMWRMLQASEAIDLCIGTGEMHSVREFVVAAFEHAGLDWRRHVHVDERLFRANEVPELQCKKWAREIDWLPRTAFAGLVKIMVQAELDLALVAL